MSKTTIWFSLILCNIIWSLNPSAAKIIIKDTGPEFAAWFKYTSATLIYITVMLARKLKSNSLEPVFGSIFIPLYSKRDVLTVFIIGITTCFLSPVTQMYALRTTGAISNSLLVGLEPIFVVFFGLFILKEKPRNSDYLALLIAFFGFSYFSGIISTTRHLFNQGDFILVVAIACESLYSVLARVLTKKYKGPVIFGSSMTIGAILLTISYLIYVGVPDFTKLTLNSWIACFWLGPIGTAAAYLIWLRILSTQISLVAMVTTLFFQPILGAIFGSVILSEEITSKQIIGGSLITVAVLVQLFFSKPSISVSK